MYVTFNIVQMRIYEENFNLLFRFIIILFSDTTLKSYNLIALEKEDSSGYITYRGTSIRVQIPDVYEMKETDFRGVWISTMTGDVASYSSIDQYKAEINRVFTVMENYNLNAMVFSYQDL